MTAWKFILYILIIATIGFILFIGYWFYVFNQSGLLDSSSKAELIENYRKHTEEITDLKTYFNSIVPDSYSVYIEFNDDNKIDLWVHKLYQKNTFGGRAALFQQWNINPYQYQEEPPNEFDTSEYAPLTKSLEMVKQRLHWNDATFKKIKAMLDNAHCISISSGEPAEIGFARSGMGNYSYAVFENAIPDSLKANFNDSCTYLLYNDKLALVYGGGAIGSQCFPDE